MQVGASGTGSRLAHWPPPMRAQHNKPILAPHHPGEPVQQHTRPRGWRLTRAMFSEFEDDES
jgi:hypothetical protein